MAEKFNPEEYVQIKWQDGTVTEAGRNGVQVAEALEVVLKQLQSYQDRFPCKENEMSIIHLEQAIMWQEKRTMDRMKRGVEGQHTL